MDVSSSRPYRRAPESDTEDDEGRDWAARDVLSRLPFRLSGRRAISAVLFAVVVYTLVIPQIGGARRALTVVGGVSPWMVGLAFVLVGLSLMSYAEMTRRLLRPTVELGFTQAMAAVLASYGLSHLIPGGAATTAAVNYRVLGRAGVPAKELGVALGIQAVLSAVVLNLMLWLALLISIPQSGFHPLYASASLLGAVLLTAVGVVMVAAMRGGDRVVDRVARLLGRLPRVEADRIRNGVALVAGRLDHLGSDHRRLAIVAGLAAANWLFDAAALWVMVWAFGHRPGAVGVVVGYGLANVLAAVPVSPGGLGVIEAVLIPTLVGFGTPRAEASIGVVAYRLVSFWLPIPIGALAYAWSGAMHGRRRSPKPTGIDGNEAKTR